MTKICEFCQTEFTPQRADARFCSKTCKSKYWYNQKKLPATADNLLESSLKGVLNDISEIDTPQQNDFVIIKESVISTEYIALKKLQREMTAKKGIYEAKIKIAKKDIEKIQNMNGQEIQAICTGIGVVVTDPHFKKPVNNIVGGFAGLIVGSIINDSLKNDREVQKKNLLFQKNEELRNLQANLTVIHSNLEKIETQLAITPISIVKERKEPRPQLALPLETVIPQNIKPSEITPVLKPIIAMKNAKEVSSEKIISSKELAKYDYKALCFTGKWMQFIGYPSINFQCAIHGRAGEGKSTFAIQFALYLAENFGKALYISSEEGFSKTFKDKFVLNNALSDNLYVADLKSYDDIIKEIPVNAYHFIFVDSLNNMRIDAEMLKKFRERYKNSAIITISQATKDGKMRGSYEIIHDVDIEIIVTNGVATTNKNRFKEKELKMEIF